MNVQEEKKTDVHSMPPPYSSISPDDNIQVSLNASLTFNIAITCLTIPIAPIFGLSRKLHNFLSYRSSHVRKTLNTSESYRSFSLQSSAKPKPQPRSKLPDLPNVPSNLPDLPEDNIVNKPDDTEIDFDDLSRRFEELKKRH